MCTQPVTYMFASIYIICNIGTSAGAVPASNNKNSVRVHSKKGMSVYSKVAALDEDEISSDEEENKVCKYLIHFIIYII